MSDGYCAHGKSAYLRCFECEVPLLARERDRLKGELAEARATSEGWRLAELRWQDWAEGITGRPEGGRHGDSSARGIISARMSHAEAMLRAALDWIPFQGMLAKSARAFLAGAASRSAPLPPQPAPDEASNPPESPDGSTSSPTPHVQTVAHPVHQASKWYERVCSCGWKGPPRAIFTEALDDACPAAEPIPGTQPDTKGKP